MTKIFQVKNPSGQIVQGGPVQNVTTIGLSPKTVYAGAVPFLITIVGCLITLAVTGELDDKALTVALTGLAGSLLSFGGAFVASPGDIAITRQPVEGTSVRINDEGVN